MSKGQGDGKEKIDRSAEALRVRHHPFLFPSESKLCDNAVRAITRTKKQRMANTCRCEVVYFHRSNFLQTGDCFAENARNDK
jgi:hypothetical protein